jgi:hypothetical protein
VIKVRIENDYSDGHRSVQEIDVAAPRISESDWLDGSWTVAVEEWWEEVVYEHTGDGHGIDVDGSCYTATIIEGDPALVGLSNEWTD